MRELAILVGLQGAGKSTFCRRRLPGHAHVSNDDFPSARDKRRRCRELIERAFRQGRSVVVDNTNATAEVRVPLIALGRAWNARVIGYYFDVPVADCLERNRRRAGKTRVPDVAIFATAKRLRPPVREEGFDELRVVRAALAKKAPTRPRAHVR